MPKTTLKKELKKRSKEQLMEQIMDLHKKYPQVKEYYNFYINPNEPEMLEKYRQVIINEFYPSRGEPKMKFSVAKKAISNFKALSPSSENLADLMLTLPETATYFTCDYGDMWEQFYISAAKNFEVALKYMQKEGLLDRFKSRIDTCVEKASHCGWGFGDDLDDIHSDYFNE